MDKFSIYFYSIGLITGFLVPIFTCMTILFLTYRNNIFDDINDEDK